jgi:MoaA/NifB/PqqE/SkfB family radical SAM enzyme
MGCITNVTWERLVMNNISTKLDINSSLKILTVYHKILQISEGKIPTPVIVEIFLTNYCNFDCPHCRSKYKHGDCKEYMPLEIFIKLLDELNRYDIRTIEFSGGGEPLLHPQIEAIFDALISRGFRIGLITNGYPLITFSKLFLQKMLSCSDWIRLSVDAFTTSKYKEIHGKTDISYNTLRRTIIKIIKMADKTAIGIKMLLSKINVCELDIAIKEAIALNPNYFQFKFVSDNKIAIDIKKQIKYKKILNNKLKKLQKHNVVFDFLPSYSGKFKEKRCLLTALHAVIDWDGGIYICPFFNHRESTHKIGNIIDGGFFKHWGTLNHKNKMELIDMVQCVPNCPLSRYNPMVKFIKTNYQHFKYI